jgi:hypothetical protein
MQRRQPLVIVSLVLINAATGWALGTWPLWQSQLPMMPWSLVLIGAFVGLTVGLWFGREDVEQAAPLAQALPADGPRSQQGEATLRTRKAPTAPPIPPLPSAQPSPKPAQPGQPTASNQPVAQIISQDAVKAVFTSNSAPNAAEPIPQHLRDALAKMSDGAEDAFDALFGFSNPTDDEDDDEPSNTSTVVAQLNPADIARVMANAAQQSAQSTQPATTLTNPLTTQSQPKPSLKPMPAPSLPNPVEASLRRTGILLQQDIEARLAQRQASTAHANEPSEEPVEKTSKFARPSFPPSVERSDDVPTSIGRALALDDDQPLPSLPTSTPSLVHPDDINNAYADLPQLPSSLPFAPRVGDTTDRATVVAQSPPAPPELHPFIDEKSRPVTARMRVPTSARLDPLPVPKPDPAPALPTPKPDPSIHAQILKKPDALNKTGGSSRPPVLSPAVSRPSSSPGLPSTKPSHDSASPPPASAFLNRTATSLGMPAATPSPAVNQALPTLSPLPKQQPASFQQRLNATQPLPQMLATPQAAPASPANTANESSQMTELSAMTTLSELAALAQMSEKSALTNIEQLRATGSAVPESDIDALFRDYVKALEETGKLHTTSINPTAFSAYIRRERGKVERKYNTDRIDMFVRVSQGKPRIVIRPIKPS